jgi:hypothetical protein
LLGADLIEHDGDDLRGLPFLDRKAALARLLRNIEAGILLKVSRTSAVDLQRSSLFETSDLLALSVTRAPLLRSEKMTLRRMIRAISHAVRGRIKLPVMVGPCVGQPIMSWGVSGVRVTRPIVARHIG